MMQVTEFSQNKILRKYGFSTEFKGICFGLSYVWCRFLVKDEMPVSDAEQQIFDGELKNTTRAVAIHRSYTQRFAAEKERNGNGDSVGFVQQLAKGDAMGCTAHWGYEEISKRANLLRPGQAMMLSFHFDDGAHATAVGNDDGALIFFDPNFGRYYVDNPKNILPFLRGHYKGIDLGNLRVCSFSNA